MLSEMLKYSFAQQIYRSRRRGLQGAALTSLLVSAAMYLYNAQQSIIFQEDNEFSQPEYRASYKSYSKGVIGTFRSQNVTQDPFFNLDRLQKRLDDSSCKTDLPTKEELMQPPYTSWAVSRFMAYYNIVRYLNMRWNASQIGSMNVLDVGGSRFLSSINAKLNITKTNNPGIDIHSTGFSENQFDAVVADQVLEHLIYPPLAMLEIHRILKPGGLVVLTTVAYNPLHEHPTFHDLWRFLPDGLRVLSAPFDGGIKLCGSWGSKYFITARAQFGLGSRKENRYIQNERTRLLTSNAIDHPVLVWTIAEK